MHAKDPKDQINASEGLIFLCKGKSIGILIFFKIVQLSAKISKKTKGMNKIKKK